MRRFVTASHQQDHERTRVASPAGSFLTVYLSLYLTGPREPAIPWTPAVALAATMPLLGYAGATCGVSQGALVALAVPTGDRRRAVAINRAAFNAGFVIGPPIGALPATDH